MTAAVYTVPSTPAMDVKDSALKSCEDAQPDGEERAHQSGRGGYSLDSVELAQSYY